MVGRLSKKRNETNIKLDQPIISTAMNLLNLSHIHEQQTMNLAIITPQDNKQIELALLVRTIIVGSDNKIKKVQNILYRNFRQFT